VACVHGLCAGRQAAEDRTVHYSLTSKTTTLHHIGKKRTHSEIFPNSTFIRDEIGPSPSPPNTRFAETFLATKDGFIAIVRSTSLKGDDVTTLLRNEFTVHVPSKSALAGSELPARLGQMPLRHDTKQGIQDEKHRGSLRGRDQEELETVDKS
jgi:hypothetical protein